MYEEPEPHDGEQGQPEDDVPTVNLTTAIPLLLERRRLPDDPELAPNAAVIGTYLDGRLIARSVAPPEWEPEADHGLFETPRHLHYRGRNAEGGTLYAEIGALIPAADLPREPWQAEPESSVPPALLLLGVVVRLPGDRVQDDLTRECLDHFATIVGSGAEPVADRVLKSL
jgi:hypothetical protein